MANLTPVGSLSDGRTVQVATLGRPGGLTVEVLDYGAAVRSLRVPTPRGPVEAVLGFDSADAYEGDGAYQGVVVGRFANRIAGARFAIDGEVSQVTANEGANCLHGGALGLNKRLWRFEELADDSAVLVYRSPDGEEGFPGELEARVRFSVAADTLQIEWEATASRPTPVNLTHHLYFNLSGEFGRDVLDHTLSIRAEAFTPVQPDLIPTGELSLVAGTPFDLRSPVRLGEVVAQQHPQLEIGGGVDHNWALDGGEGAALRLGSPESGLMLSMTTDQPGVQIYSGQGLKAPFVPYGGIAIEPQGFPDAVNQPAFPPAVLRAGQAYRRRAAYRFEVVA